MSTGIVKPNWVLVKGEYKYVLDQQINNIGRRDPNNPAKALEVTLEVPYISF